MLTLSRPAWAALALTAIAVAGLNGCGDEGPQGYSVADLETLPESRLIVPDGEIIGTVTNKGGTLISY